MKKFFIYFSGVLYSVKECLLTWKMPKRYPIIAFILSFFILFSPIQFDLLATPTSVLINQVPNIQYVLKDVAIDLNNKNIDAKIENNKIVCSEKYEAIINGYKVLIGVTLEEYPEVEKNNPKDSDNLIVFGEETFYARFVERTDLGIETNTMTLTGDYSKSNSFTFNTIYQVKDNEDSVYNVVGSFLKTIYLSNSVYYTVIWLFIIEMFNLLFMLLGAFVLLFANNKGNRDYKLTYGQCFLTMMGAMVFPSMISAIIGMINFSYFTMSYIILSLIRLFMLCFAQISKNEKYNQIKKEDSDNLELNFK